MSASSSDRENERTGGGGDDAEEKVNTEGWLTTYSDMVTLMLTFFVLMFALSNSSTEKMEMFLLAMSRDGISPEQFWEIKDKYKLEDLDYDSWDDSFPLPLSTGDQDQIRGGAAALQELHQKMTEHIDQEGLGDVIAISFNGELLLMTLPNDILFDSGKADMTSDMIETSEVIARLLAETIDPNDPFEIVVAGHTDNVIMNSAQYPSNWHLSMARAGNFLYELVARSQIDPGLFYARACGEYRPIATNETEDGRQQNRRVEIMVSLARDNPLWDVTSN